MKGRNAQVARIYKVLTILEGAPHGLTCKDIQSRLDSWGFQVSDRTVYRDLDALRAAGFPLDVKGKSDDNADRWCLEKAPKVSHFITLNSREILALYLTKSMLNPLRESPLYEDLESTYGKIEEKIGSSSRKYLDELRDDIKFDTGQQWGVGISSDILDTVTSSCNEKQLLTFEYESVNKEKSLPRRVGPHFIYFAKGSLYLVAEDMEEGRVKTFAIPRMSHAQMLDDPYTGGAVDPEVYFQHSFGIFRASSFERIKILFGPTVAPFIRERRWHASQRVVQKKSGWIEVQLEVGITPELVQWVLGFGADAKVIEPASLIEKVRDGAASVLTVYDRAS